MANEQNLKPFKKGHDPRRNLRGVPKDAIEARRFFRRIGAELLKLPNSDEEITRLEALVRLKFGSKAPKDFETILKAMFPGLLKDEHEVKVTTGYDVNLKDDDETEDTDTD